MAKKSFTLQVRVSEDEKSRLEKISKKTYLTTSQIVRRGIDTQYKEFFENEKDKK